MAKKIAILGGGMAGLAAAYHLTNTPALRLAHKVTVYQMGWRLGGKAASGRDAPHFRNLEHGLHMWFGCYHNVFEITRGVYAEWQKPPGCPLQTVDDVAKKQSYTPIGVRKADGRWTFFPVHWPENNAVPGVGGQEMPPGEAFVTLLDLFEQVVRGVASELGISWNGVFSLGPNFAEFIEAADYLAGEIYLQQLTEAERAEQVIFLVERGYAVYKLTTGIFEQVLTAMDHPLGTKLRVVRELFDVMAAAVRGYYRDLAVPNLPYEAIDDLEFREWLLGHGATPDIVEGSSVVHMLYDTMFQYIDGDVERPSYAAGTALGVLARLLGTFKGAMMWDIQAGMGEALVAPLYEVLKARGVEFEFFHKVKRLELSADRRSVARIVFDVQAQALNPPYRPVDLLNGVNVKYWPSEPFWNQLANGAALRAARVSFESHWNPAPPAAARTLRHGPEGDPNADFQEVVLAIAMGAYKPLNNVDAGPCAELIASDPAFERFVRRQWLVPSQGLQLWSDRTLQQLGWTSGHAAMVSGPQYLNIWADMSQVLAFEPWPGVTKPRSLHYLTGTFKTQLHKEPSTNAAVPGLAHAQLRGHALDWLNRRSYVILPNATNGVVFNHAVLTDPGNGAGVARFDAQYLRANIDPTECCVASAAGTTKFRLGPRDHRFTNLVLAGEGTRHGFNTTTIEGAVMSGVAAARAISGQPANIVGYDFLTTPL